MANKPEGYLMMTMLTPKDVNGLIMDVCTVMDADQADTFLDIEDRKQIFLNILKGGSDITREVLLLFVLIDELCANYDAPYHLENDNITYDNISVERIQDTIKLLIKQLQRILPPNTNKRAMSLYKLREAIWWLGVED